MYELKNTGTLYIIGQIGSFLSFLLSHAERKTLIFYETEDEAILFREEIEFFSKGNAYIFPIYSERVFEKEDEVKRTAFLHHLAMDEGFIGLFPYNAAGRNIIDKHLILDNTKIVRFGETLFKKTWFNILMKGDMNWHPLSERKVSTPRGEVL